MRVDSRGQPRREEEVLVIPTLADIEAARTYVAAHAWRTPLVRLDPLRSEPFAGDVEVYLKLENLQKIGAFKLRGAAAVVGELSSEELAAGLVTASAGNMAQAVAFLARELGVPCTVLVPEFAPHSKIVANERLGARVIRVSYEQWWRAFQERSFPGVEGTFVHAFDDTRVMAGNGTIALEVLEELPEVDAIVTPWGGGGLTCGVAVAVRELKPACRVVAAEVQGAAPFAAALQAGRPVEIEYTPSFVDGIGSRTVFPQMFERARRLEAASAVASVSEVAEALLLMAERNHVVAEGAGACPVACAVAGRAGTGKVVCVVSGGNIDLAEVAVLIGGSSRGALS